MTQPSISEHQFPRFGWQKLLVAKRWLKPAAAGEKKDSYTGVGDPEAAFLGGMWAAVHRCPDVPVDGSSGDVMQLVGRCVPKVWSFCPRRGPQEHTGQTPLSLVLQCQGLWQGYARWLWPHQSARCRMNKRV